MLKKDIGFLMLSQSQSAYVFSQASSTNLLFVVCLTLFKQPLSFCDNIKAEDKLKCIRDRAIIAQNPAICEKAVNQEVKDECYFGYASHFDPKVSICEKIIDQMKKNMCYTEVAIKLSRRQKRIY